MRNKYLALGVTALLALGAGCTSSSTTNSTDTTNSNTDTTNATPTLQVPVDPNSNVNEMIVVDEDDSVETDETTDEADETTDTTDTEDANEDVADDDDATETEDADDEADDDTTEATIQTFDVVATQFEFTPSTITVNKGDTVQLNLSSEDVPHGFALSAFNVSETLTPGKTKTVEFVADQAGTFTFSCNIVCGAGHSGMSGQLIVEE